MSPPLPSIVGPFVGTWGGASHPPLLSLIVEVSEGCRVGESGVKDVQTDVLPPSFFSHLSNFHIGV